MMSSGQNRGWGWGSERARRRDLGSGVAGDGLRRPGGHEVGGDLDGRGFGGGGAGWSVCVFLKQQLLQHPENSLPVPEL